MKENQTPENHETQEKESLSLQDLLIDEKANVLSEYLSLSITNLGADTQVSVTTTDAVPTTYSSIFYGVSAVDLQSLVGDVHNNND